MTTPTSIKQRATAIVPFIQSGTLYTAAAFIVSILNYFFNLSLARFFSLSDYGEYTTSLSYVLLLSVPIGALGVALVKRIGRTAESERWNVSLSVERWMHRILWRHKFALMGTVVIFSIIFSSVQLRWESALMIILLWILTTFGTIYPSALQAGRRFLWVSTLLVVVTGVKVAGLLLIPTEKTLLFVYSLLIVAGLTQIGIGAWLLRKLASNKNHVSSSATLQWDITTVLKRKSIYLPVLSSLGLMGMITLDVILAKVVLPSDQVGLYAGLSMFSKILLYITGPLSAVAFTFFAGKETKSNSKAILIFCTALICFVSIVAGILYVLIPGFFTVLVLGPAYSVIGGSLWIAAIFGGLYSIASLVTQFLIAQGSRLGLLSLLAVAAQAAGILMFHQSLTQVMLVNSIVALCLCVGYAIGLLRMRNRNFVQQL